LHKFALNKDPLTLVGSSSEFITAASITSTVAAQYSSDIYVVPSRLLNSVEV